MPSTPIDSQLLTRCLDPFPPPLTWPEPVPNDPLNFSFTVTFQFAHQDSVWCILCICLEEFWDLTILIPTSLPSWLHLHFTQFLYNHFTFQQASRTPCFLPHKCLVYSDWLIELVLKEQGLVFYLQPSRTKNSH